MGSYAQEIANHPIHAAVDTIMNSLELVRASTHAHAPEADEQLARIEVASRFLKGLLASTDPYLIPHNKLNEMLPAAESTYSQLQVYLETQDIGELGSASSNASSLLLLCPFLIRPSSQEDVQQLGIAAVNLRKAYETAQRRAIEDVARHAKGITQVEAELTRLQDTLTTLQTQTSSLVSDFQGQFSKAQDARTQSFNETHTIQQKSQAELIEKYRTELFNQSREADRQFKEAQEANNQRVEDLNAEFSATAKQIVEDIESKQRKVEQMLGVIGTLGISAGYKKAADDSRSVAIKWQIATVVAILLLIIFASFAFWPSKDTNITWEGLAARIFLTFSFGVLAAYCGFQGDRSQHAERRNRKIALEFEALGAYLDPLPEDKQHEFRLKLADLSFGKDDPKFTKEDRSPASLWDLIAKNPELAKMILDKVQVAK